jgi:hypothetical protein
MNIITGMLALADISTMTMLFTLGFSKGRKFPTQSQRK